MSLWRSLNLTEEAFANLSVSCNYVNQFNSSEEQCTFVSWYADCAYSGIIYDYTSLTYCQLPSNLRPLAIFILICILLFMFMCISVVADDFLCPNLLVMSKTFRLPDNIAGVTFLAFGNGAPDVFSSISGISQSKPELIFASLYGGGIFDSTIVVAAILLVSKKTQLKRPIIRDIIFYLIAALIVFLFIRSGQFTLAYSIALLCFYAFYIVVISISRFVYLKIHKQVIITPEDELHEEGIDHQDAKLEDTSSSDLFSNGKHREKVFLRQVTQYRTFRGNKLSAIGKQDSEESVTSESTVYTISSNQCLLSVPNPTQVYYHEVNNNYLPDNALNYHSQTFKPKPLGWAKAMIFAERCGLRIKPKYAALLAQQKYSIWSMECMTETRHFVLRLCPVDLSNWSETRWYGKIMPLVQALPYFFMNICIPVVDIEKPQENWSRMLICLNVICAPQAAYFLLSVDVSINNQFPVWLLLLLISLFVVCLILFTSSHKKAPMYHRVFAFVGFAVGVIFTNAISNEIIALLSALGAVFNLSNSILGMTVMAWGNCIGDLVADMSMARAGYPSMALAAAFCGPMFNLLVGLGLPYTILLARDGLFQVSVSPNDTMFLVYATISTSLCISLVIFIVNHKFNFRYTSVFQAVVLLSLYALYITFACLLEFKVI